MIAVSFILSLIFGVFLGIIIGVYFKIRKIRKLVNAQIKNGVPNTFTDGQISAVTEIAERTKKQFKKSTKGNVIRSVLGLKRKESKSVILSIKEEITEVADCFGESGKQNLLNFSVKSFFDFLYGVTRRLEEIIGVINFSPLKTVDVSAVLGLKKKADKTKPVLQKASGVWGVISRIINAINPYFWIKKLVMNLFMAMTVSEIVFASLELCAWEFAFFYGSSASGNEKR